MAGNVIISDTLPAATLAFDTTLVHAGSQWITLPGGTPAEQHFFLTADPAGVIQRLYWVQFEGPGHYSYSSNQAVEVSGRPFRAHFRFYPPAGFSDPPGSDGTMARHFLEAKGFRLGEDLVRVRLVWVLEPDAAHEVMIIYLENLAPHGLTVAGLEADPGRWTTLQASLLQRATTGILIIPKE